MDTVILILIFIISTFVGFFVINKVPSLLHTPLMSGMNALSGITVLGALTATGAAVYTGNRIMGYVAIILAMLNVAGGFGVTGRMLEMFKEKQERVVKGE